MTSVLLAEDDTSISEPLARALRREGYTVEVSPDGPQALERALGGGVDLIVLDSPDDAQSSSAIQLALPQAVNVCAGLKACPANVPAIVPSQV